MGLELARKLGNPTLILSPTVTIKNQWIDRFVNLFMPEGLNAPDWISENVYDLKYLNSITYQGLHYAYKKSKIRKQNHDDETDDEIQEETFDENIDVKEYNLIKEIKKQHIKTIVLDEAHHLKSEWWQSLTKVVESLEDVKIISLTATPPYDIDESEWKKYINLCGDIDIEISVPELVQAKNLCPHQDYIYFSYPTSLESQMIMDYSAKLKDFLEKLKKDQDFIDILKSHPYLIDTNNNIEPLLENSSFYSSMIIFLNSVNVEIEKEQINVLGHNSKIPQLNLEWLEILLNYVLFSNDKYFEEKAEKIDSIRKELNKIGAIEKKTVSIRKNSLLQKYLVNSISKLKSINKIVNIEYNNLKENLGMVILTDFLRKECLFEENMQINKLGVFPIFLNLLNENSSINMAILTGSIFMIPKNQKDNLMEIIKEKGLLEEDIDFIDVPKTPTYTIVKTKEKYKNELMNSISKLFSTRKINIIIGTKSLLGEGWDEPSINSLILASYVGSYVLSNQMRGRAIRTSKDPNKTANIWHLVCTPKSQSEIYFNQDFEMLRRRFRSFVGIGYTKMVLENGIDRLDLIDQKVFALDAIIYNNKIKKLSNDREQMYKKWFDTINYYGDVRITNQLVAKSQNIKNELNIIDPKRYLILILTFVLFSSLRIQIHGLGITPYILMILLFALINSRIIFQTIRAIHLATPRNQLRIIAKIVIKTLWQNKLIDTDIDKINVNVRVGDYTNINLSVSGVTTHENRIILDSVKEVFSQAENQRYILVDKKKKNSKFFNVPNLLAQNKELAESFHKNWEKHIGKIYMYYTNSLEGRRVLIEARKKSFDFTNEDKFISKKMPEINWK